MDEESKPSEQLVEPEKVIDPTQLSEKKPDADSGGEIAFKRTAALLIDYILVSGLTLLPILINRLLAVSPEKSLDSFAIIIALALLVSPLPLIYWRIFFKIGMHRSTPGEQTTGVASFAKKHGSARWFSEIGYGIVQYFYLFISLIVATLACNFFFFVLLGNFFRNTIPVAIAIPIMFVAWLFFFAVPLYLAHRAKSQVSRETSADIALSREVKLLR